MNRYYNAEHIKKLIKSHEWRMTLAKERGGNGFVEYDKLVLDSKEFQKRLSSLPTIEVGDVNDDLIKRQDVIKIIDKYYKQFIFISDADEVIAEIESLQTVIPSEDCISRKVLLERMRREYGVEWQFIDIIENAPSVVPALEEERPEIIRCRNCRHDNNCEIQYSAQAGSEFFCGSAERRVMENDKARRD